VSLVIPIVVHAIRRGTAAKAAREGAADAPALQPDATPPPRDAA
jgi:hypothetical protein